MVTPASQTLFISIQVRRCSPVVIAIVVACACATAMATEPGNGSFFRTKIEPVLKAHCLPCHSRQSGKVQGGLRLDSQAGLLRGGDSGPAIVSGESDRSLLIQAIRHENGLAMPAKQPKLANETIADFVKWVEMGAPDPRDKEPIDGASVESARTHWAFQPIRKPAIPSPRNAAGNEVDAFLGAVADDRDPAADKRTLIRRVTFDLIGLPPTPEEVEAFVSDEFPDAYDRLVDRLLGSQHFGEKAAQSWLDVVRFAETEGYEYDRHIPDAWRYRDYVIESFNRDKPFDRFLTEQIAGDEIDSQNHEYLAAAIFHRLGPVRRNAGNPEIALSRNEVLTERTDILGAAILGLTVGCARCHDHKLEPISQKDYYQLQAYLAATEENNLVLATDAEKSAWELATKRAKDELARVQKLAKEAKGAEQTRLNRKAEELEDQLPAPLPTIPSTRNDFSKRTPIHVLKRGVWENKGELVQPRPLSVLVAENVAELSPGESQPRTHLANWLTAPDHPLTARVIVNRLWQQHFGVGLVKTANDFGINGDRPTHPELLDWLAASLIENGWRLKSLHRAMVLSAKYQKRVSTGAPDAQRFRARRLSAEEIRDAMLAVSGRLNPKSGGPSVLVPVDPELVSLLYKPSQWTVTTDVREHDRRSIYLIAKRNLRLPFFENLDAPALQTSCARRESSTHPPQALELLNGQLANDLAKAFASRLEKECGDDRVRLIDRAFHLALGRSPTALEQKRSLTFLRETPVSEFALAIFNLNEFVYIR